MGLETATKRAVLRLIPRRRVPKEEDTMTEEQTTPDVPQAPLTIEEQVTLAYRNGSQEQMAEFQEALLGTVGQAIDAKITEAGAGAELPFVVEDRLPENVYAVLVFGVGRSGKPGHWFEYRTKE